jgi:hypothetical protein
MCEFANRSFAEADARVTPFDTTSSASEQLFMDDSYEDIRSDLISVTTRQVKESF